MFHYTVKFYGIILSTVGMGMFFLPIGQLLMDGAFTGKEHPLDITLTLFSMAGFTVLFFGVLVFFAYQRMNRKQHGSLTAL